jgi:hypothetical protein
MHALRTSHAGQARRSEGHGRDRPAGNCLQGGARAHPSGAPGQRPCHAPPPPPPEPPRAQQLRIPLQLAAHSLGRALSSWSNVGLSVSRTPSRPVPWPPGFDLPSAPRQNFPLHSYPILLPHRPLATSSSARCWAPPASARTRRALRASSPASPRPCPAAQSTGAHGAKPHIRACMHMHSYTCMYACRFANARARRGCSAADARRRLVRPPYPCRHAGSALRRLASSVCQLPHPCVNGICVSCDTMRVACAHRPAGSAPRGCRPLPTWRPPSARAITP